MWLSVSQRQRYVGESWPVVLWWIVGCKSSTCQSIDWVRPRFFFLSFFFFLHTASRFWARKWKYRFRWIHSDGVFLWLYVRAEIDWRVTVWLFSQVYYMLGLMMADVGQGLCTMELKAAAVSWLVDSFSRFICNYIDKRLITFKLLECEDLLLFIVLFVGLGNILIICHYRDIRLWFWIVDNMT